MPNEKPSEFIAGLPHRVRAWREGFSTDYRQWRADLATDWTLLYRNPIGAVVFVILGVVLAVVIIRTLVSFLPAAAGSAGGEADPPFAILHVACTNQDCQKAYDTKRPLDFRNWPIECDYCKQKTVYRATLCPVCHKWFAVPPTTAATCPYCAARNKPVKSEEPQKSKTPIDLDDLDDR